MKSIIERMIDWSETVFKASEDLFEMLSDTVQDLWADLPLVGEISLPTEIGSLALVDFILGGVGFFIVYSIAKWIIGIVTGA